MKRFLFASLVGGAAVFMGGALGVSYAQSTPTPAPAAPAALDNSAHQRHQAILSDAASQLGISVDQLQSALVQARKDVGPVRPLASLRKDELEVAARAIGLPDAQTLRTQLAGSALTAVAQNHNVQPSTVSAAIVADLTSKLQAEVAAGKLNASQIPALTQRAQTRVSALMTHQFPARGTTS